MSKESGREEGEQAKGDTVRHLVSLPKSHSERVSERLQHRLDPQDKQTPGSSVAVAKPKQGTLVGTTRSVPSVLASATRNQCLIVLFSFRPRAHVCSAVAAPTTPRSPGSGALNLWFFLFSFAVDSTTLAFSSWSAVPEANKMMV